ncbi:membrane metalloprotease [Zobellia alginiliquefaciens]|uniref:membrane metalloprotease n=1 Tax=Zobellia alginiliquefaciens TaxID=3032586 RepID=UPI0023E388DE|nr:membrane metalloprotease [Zobellia alginiliquefaciens]
MKYSQHIYKHIFTLLFTCLIASACSKNSDKNTDTGENSKEQIQTVTDDEGNTKEVDVSGNKKSVGDSSNDLLSQDTYNAIIFELFYVAGFKPTESTIENFEEFVSQRLNKPEQISLELIEIESPGQEVYSIEDIRDLEDDIRTQYNLESTIAVFGIFLDGEYSKNTENGSVLGIAYQNTSFVIFEETVKSFSGQTLGPSLAVLESTVLKHEFGHLLGMVNAGTPMQTEHQDTEHGRHCTDDKCLMYWTAETGEGLVNMLSGGTVPNFDSQCLADLKAHGGK